MSVKGIIPGLFSKRHDQHPGQMFFGGVTELGEAYGHFFMPSNRLGAVGPKQTVPPREIKAEVTVCFPDDDGMVHPVHIRRHDKEAQVAVQEQRKLEIAVVEHCSPVEDYFKKNYRENGRAKGSDGSHLDKHADDYFDRMKAKSGGHINIQVSVVHHVHPPEERYSMEHDMLQIDNKIKGQNAQQDGKPVRQIEDIEKPPALLLGCGGYLDADYREEQAQGKGINGNDTYIAHPAPCL